MAYTKYSLTPANNTAAPPDGAPEGMLPSAVNDTMRDMMAQIRDVGDGIRGGTYTMTAPIITGGTITGSTINNSAIGGTTAAAGAFTTLSASGVATVSAGAVGTPAITTTGDTNTGIFFPAADTIAFTEGGVESMRIDSSGNVGVNNTSPAVLATTTQVAIKANINGDSMFVAQNSNGLTTAKFGFQYTGSIDQPVIGSQTNHPFLFLTNNTERMRIATGGTGELIVGGTTATLSSGTRGNIIVNGSASALFQLNIGNANQSYIGHDSGGMSIWNATNTIMGFATNNTERMRIDSSGNVLIGKTSKNNTSGNGFQCESNGTVNVVTSSSTSSFDTYEIYSTGAGAYRFYVTAGGVINATSTSISAISDQRLKENVRPLDLGLAEVLSLQPRRYDWIEGKGQNKKDAVGFIAQEFETVLPNSVGTSKAGEDGIEYKNINYEELVPTLVKAIQELKTELDSVKAELQILKGN